MHSLRASYLLHTGAGAPPKPTLNWQIEKVFVHIDLGDDLKNVVNLNNKNMFIILVIVYNYISFNCNAYNTEWYKQI